MPHRPLRHLKRQAIALGSLAAVGLGGAVALADPGDLDRGFNGNGTRAIDHGGTDLVTDVLVQPDGKLLLAGFGTANQSMAVTRLDPDGSTDPSFDGDGTALVELDGDDRAQTAALQADGKIVVAGYVMEAASTAPAVARLNANGSPDGSFAGDGSVLLDYNGNGSLYDVLVEPDGRILLVGYGGPNLDFAITRLNSNGSPVEGFGVDGTLGVDLAAATPNVARAGRMHTAQTVPPPPPPPPATSEDVARAVALQEDGKIVVVGDTSLGGEEKVAVVRLNPSGTLDASFDGDGIRTLDFGSSADNARDVLVQGDGKILVIGAGGAVNMTVTRLNPNGSLDQSFNGTGTVGADFGGSEYAEAAALQANGKIVVAGRGGQGFAPVMRLQPGGALDTTFSGDGKQRVTAGTDAGAYGLAVQDNGRVLLGGYSLTGANFDFLAARLEGDTRASGGGPANTPGGGPRGGGGRGGSGNGPAGRVPRCNGKRATIVGSTRGDRLKGTRRADVIVSLGGNDRISGGRGNDTICAGTGKDRISGGPGNDRLDGGTGNDTLAGQGGKDTLLGRSGKDKLQGGPGRDKQRQ